MITAIENAGAYKVAPQVRFDMTIPVNLAEIQALQKEASSRVSMAPVRSYQGGDVDFLIRDMLDCVTAIGERQDN